MSERALSALTNIIIVNETSDKAIVTCSWGSEKKHDRKKGVREVKSWGTSDLDDDIIFLPLKLMF